MAIKLGTFGDMAREKPLDLTKDGQCSNCGSCCSNMLPLSDSEVKRIKHYIRQHKIEPRKHLVPLAKQTIDMTCPFMELGKAEKCTIYPIRPQVCRSFLCSRTILDSARDEELHREKRTPRNVRQTFFGGD